MKLLQTFPLLISFVIIGLFICAPSFVSAQSVIEEVVVTAQKREESVQDVPISIQAFNGDSMDELGIHSSEDVMQIIPNAGLSAPGGSKQNFFIRGVGTVDFQLNVVGAVGVYLDDVALNSPFAVSFSTLDTERVEVLRGPQNTLFGRNTTGGAVNFVSRKPSQDDGLNGYIEAGYGSYDQVDVEAGVGFPIGDNAAARVAMVSNTRDGVFNNLTLGEDVGNRESQAGRGQILWQPTDNWEFLVNVHGGVKRGNPVMYKAVGILDPNNVFAPCPVPVNNLTLENNPNCIDASGFSHQFNDWEDVNGNLKHKEDVDSWGTSFKAIWDVGSLTVTSVTAYDSLEVGYNEDSDAAPTTIFHFYQEGEYDQWSEELRIQSASDQDLRWIAGFYWFFEEAEYSTAVRRTPAPLAPSGPGLFNVVPNTQVDQDNEVYSVYGQMEYDVQDTLTGTIGLRWTHETKEGFNSPSVRCVGSIGGPPFCPALNENAFIGADVIAGLPALVVLPTEVLKSSSKKWGARFALDWKVSDDALLFASASRGFKAGGFSLAALQALTGNAAQSVKPEVLWAYEIGLKSTWFENSLQFNISGFYYEWDNLQSFQILNDPNTGFGTPQLLNVPKASLIGGEIEIQWVPADGWFVMGGLGLLDSEVDNPGLINGLNKGNKLPNSPNLTFNGLVSKEIPLANGTLVLQSNWSYKDEETYDLLNAPNLTRKSIWNLNARISYRFGVDERYEINAWGQNLTEENYPLVIGNLVGVTESINDIPNLSEATYGVGVAIRFD
jgi:iron complex outermembrane recepter protein